MTAGAGEGLASFVVHGTVFLYARGSLLGCCLCRNRDAIFGKNGELLKLAHRSYNYDVRHFVHLQPFAYGFEIAASFKRSLWCERRSITKSAMHCAWG